MFKNFCNNALNFVRDPGYFGHQGGNNLRESLVRPRSFRPSELRYELYKGRKNLEGLSASLSGKLKKLHKADSIRSLANSAIKTIDLISNVLPQDDIIAHNAGRLDDMLIDLKNQIGQFILDNRRTIDNEMKEQVCLGKGNASNCSPSLAMYQAL